MPLTVPQARDEMLTQFFENWKVYAPFVVGYVPEVVWDQEEDKDADSPRSDRFWVRVSVQHSPAEQRTLGERGSVRYQQQGFLFVQVFGPRSLDQSGSDLEALAGVARDAFLSASPGGVWYRSPTVQEVTPAPGPWLQMNASVEFVYDERPPASGVLSSALFAFILDRGYADIVSSINIVDFTVNTHWERIAQLA